MAKKESAAKFEAPEKWKEISEEYWIANRTNETDKVKDIVVAHGGTIRLQDNPGGGTIFIISLPVQPEVVIEDAVMMEDNE